MAAVSGYTEEEMSEVGEDVKEGAILGDELESSHNAGVFHQPHLLEHSWTFWFDSPSAKIKQAAWGSSIRSIHTFATAEEFWRFDRDSSSEGLRHST